MPSGEPAGGLSLAYRKKLLVSNPSAAGFPREIGSLGRAMNAVSTQVLSFQTAVLALQLQSDRVREQGNCFRSAGIGTLF